MVRDTFFESHQSPRMRSIASGVNHWKVKSFVNSLRQSFHEPVGSGNYLLKLPDFPAIIGKVTVS